MTSTIAGVLFSLFRTDSEILRVTHGPYHSYHSKSTLEIRCLCTILTLDHKILVALLREASRTGQAMRLRELFMEFR